MPKLHTNFLRSRYGKDCIIVRGVIIFCSYGTPTFKVILRLLLGLWKTPQNLEGLQRQDFSWMSVHNHLFPFKTIEKAVFDLVQVLECRVCDDIFGSQGEKTPRLLFCGHTLCHACLSKLPSPTSNNVIFCPFDRQPTEIGQSRLERNFLMCRSKLVYNGEFFGKNVIVSN